MQTGFPNKRQLDLELAILNSPLYEDAREPFIGYVARLQRSETATDLRLLQRDLILDINGRQRATAEVIAEKRPEFDAELAELLKQTPLPKAKLRKVQSQLASLKLVEEAAAVGTCRTMGRTA